MTVSPNHADQLEKLRDLVKDIEYCMLTTVNPDGSLHSRPMALNHEIEENGDLWFFTYASSYKVDEVNHNHHVNVSFAAPNKQTYVALSGQAELVRDKQMMEQLWVPDLKAWFPNGIDEPDIALLKVSVEKAEYWDSPSGIVAKTIGFVKAATTGEATTIGENEKFDLK
ncbi:pyridoxamine 5'-phosphate oxidase family protein [Myxacorys almedinensis]|uniref:Pyridoxamine 5'-phosphate oxidase family protein n=1 Tax=Myxacorys almedinensis A TaxID=2690445 RepID=A0A8J7Z4H6_9CYAN|nr:pyridoxamine 5'-phosphate oxidase family protein [Myxacorys almedinensis]NDJ19180.1 pyridoxamine 5'-phosphate oxidase family protein [Myxacorys almedinensis A]